MKRLALLSVAVLLATAGLARAQEIYKWTDENGKIHFGNAPTGVEGKQLDRVGKKESDDERACREEATKACDPAGSVFGPDKDSDIKRWNSVATDSFKRCVKYRIDSCLDRRKRDFERARAQQEGTTSQLPPRRTYGNW